MLAILLGGRNTCGGCTALDKLLAQGALRLLKVITVLKCVSTSLAFTLPIVKIKVHPRMITTGAD